MKKLIAVLLSLVVICPLIFSPLPVSATNLSDSMAGSITRSDPAPVTWTTREPMPAPRFALGVVTGGNGNIYAIGGWYLTAQSTVYEYNPVTNVWSTKSPLLAQTSSAGVAAANGGKIYVIGGYPDGPTPIATVQEYNPTTDSWSYKTSMSAPRYTLAAATASNGKIYAIGGTNINLGPVISTVEEYDPTLNTWTAKASMPTARRYLAATTAGNGKIYAIGGISSDGTILNTVEEYDPITNTWTTKSPMSTSRFDPAAVAAPDGKIYVMGGYNNGSGSMATVEAYDPATDTWTPQTSMPTQRHTFGAAVGNGKIYAIGGQTATGTEGITAVVEEATLPTLVQYTLTTNVSPAGGGSVSKTPNQSSFIEGTSVQLTATPAAGWQFFNWTGDVSNPNTASTTVTMNTNKTVTAHFISLDNWPYRKTIDITGSSTDLTDYQVKVNVPFISGKMNSDFSDIRFTAADEATSLSYWLESSIASTSAIFWVKVPFIPTAGTNLFMYYGNSTAISGSNFQNTFIPANNDFELDASGTSYDAISLWDHVSWTQNDDDTHGTLGPAGENLNVSDTRNYSNTKAIYSYLQNVCRVNNWDPDSRHTIQDLYTEDAYKVVSDSSAIYIWRTDVSYTTSSRYYWRFGVIFEDGLSTSPEILLAGVSYGNQEGGIPNNDYSNDDQTAVGADGQTWYRHPIVIPDYLNKSNLVVKIRHQQDSWDNPTPTQSSLYYDLVGNIALRKYVAAEPVATILPDPINLNDWLFSKTITITGSSSALTDYQVKVPVTFVSGKMNADFSDILFTAANGTTLLGYWRESYTASASAVFWVKVPSIPTNGTTIRMYYGNPAAESTSNGENTFVFFDDYSTNKLTQYTNQLLLYQANGRVVSIENGMLKNSDNGNGDEWFIFTKNGIQLTNLAADIKLVSVDNKSGGHWQGHYLTLAPSQSNGANVVNLGYEHQNAGWPPYLAFGGGGFSDRTYDSRDGTGHTLTIAKAGNLFKALVDGEQYWSFTNDTLGAMSFYAGTYDGDNGEMSSTALYDDFRIRNYALPEPGANLGAEEANGPSSIRFTGNSVFTGWGPHFCGPVDAYAYTSLVWSGGGNSTLGNAIAEHTLFFNGINNTTVEFGDFGLSLFQCIPVGDHRIYSGGEGLVKVNGTTVLHTINARFSMDVNYVANSMTGSGWATIDVPNSDPALVAELDPLGTGQVEYIFNGFNQVVQGVYGEYEFDITVGSAAHVEDIGDVCINQNGVFNIPDAHVSLNVHSYTLGGLNHDQCGFFANQIWDSPGGVPPAGIQSISKACYWELGTVLSAVNTDVTFDLADIPAGDLPAPATTKLLVRESAVDAWQIVANQTLVDATHIRANGLTGFSEFAIGRVADYTLTTAVVGNGTVTPAVGPHTYPSGTVVDITATPNAGNHFVNWTGDVANVNSAATSVTVNANKTVTANFAANVVPSGGVSWWKLDETSGTVAVDSWTGNDGTLVTGKTNVLRGKTVTANYTPGFGTPGLITDGVFSPEDSNWQTNSVHLFGKFGNPEMVGYLMVDIGMVATGINRVVVQCDHNEPYTIEYSTDNVNWSVLYVAPIFGEWGLHTRDSGTLTEVSARYIRISATGGDVAYSVSELQVFGNPTNWVSGKSGNALSLNGTSSYLTTSDSASWDFGTGDFAIAGWINTSTPGSTMRLISAGSHTDGANNVWAFGYGAASAWGAGNRLNFAYWNGAAYTDLSSNQITINANTWYPIAIVRSGSTITFYFNGLAVGSFSNSASLNGGSTGVIIGARYYTNPTNIIEFTNGLIDEVKIYSRALTANEIRVEAGLSPQYTLTMAKTGNGTVIPEVGTHTYNSGDVVDLTATPNPSNSFVNWTGTGTVADAVDPTTTITMNGNYTITANFVAAPVHNITTGKNFLTIQAAIDDTDTVSGNIIKVDAGTYTENVNVNKSVTIQSNDGLGTTTVRAAISTDHVFEVTANNVTIDGFTIRGTGINSDKAGIAFWNVTGGRAQNNRIGMTSGQDVNGIRYDNDYGVLLYRGGQHTIIANDCVDNDYGIRMEGSVGNSIQNNYFQWSEFFDIYLTYGSTTTNGSNNNIITGNMCDEGPGIGIYLHYSNANTVNNNLIQYKVASAGIELNNADDNTIKSNTITKIWDGGNGVGIKLGLTSNPSERNTIYLNALIDNDINISVTSAPSAGNENRWYSPAPIDYVYSTHGYRSYLGNYDDDYTGNDVDGNGVGDTARLIANDNDDLYPLKSDNFNYTETTLYSLTINTTAGGTVTTPGVGQFLYAEGTVVNLVADPDAGYRFVSWSGSTGTIGTTTSATTTIEMIDESTITANFRLTSPNGGISWWKFDEASGTVANDSWDGNTGTVSGATRVPGGKVNGALSFDGADDIVQVPNSENLQITGPVAVEAWIKMDSQTYGSLNLMSVIAQKWGAAGGSYPAGYGLGIFGPAFPGGPGAGKVGFVASTTGSDINWVASDTTISIGQWYHIVGQFTGTKIQLFINGVFVSEQTFGPSIYATNAPFVIGNYNSTFSIHDGGFAGLIDEVKVYNRALTPHEIMTNYYGGSMTVSYWKLDEASGTVANDSWDGNTGTVSGATRVPGGKVNGALSFDGADDIVQVPNSENLQITGPVAVEAWIKMDSQTYGSLNLMSVIAQKWGAAGGSYPAGYGLGIFGPAFPGGPGAGKVGFVASTTGSDINWVASDTTISIGQWYHIVGQFTGTKIQLFINGVFVSEQTFGPSIYATNAPFVIGNYNSTFSIHDGGFAGLIDEVKVYDRALTPEEIRAYAGLPKSYALNITLNGSGSTNPVAGSHNYAQNEVVQIGATPALGWVFSHWSGDATGNTNPLSITMNANKNVTAHFTQIPFLSGAISWWPLNGNANDSIGGNHGTLHGGSFTSGRMGQAVRLDGVDDFIDFGNGTGLNFGAGDFTIGLWVKFASTAGEQVLIEKYVETENPTTRAGWSLTKLANNTLRFGGAGGGYMATFLDVSDPGITAGNWIHFAVTKYGNHFILYFNGSPVASADAVASINLDSPVTLKVGHRGNPVDTPGSVDNRGFFLNGTVDEVRVFNRALTANELQSLATSNYTLNISVVGSGTTDPAPGLYDNVVQGQTVNITATAAQGWVFSHWSGDYITNENPLPVVMDSNHSVTANFTLVGKAYIIAILLNPTAFVGQTVQIQGQYRGWETGHGSPPVSRSDWVVQDGTGSMYVTGSSMGLVYPNDVGKSITVTGVVRVKNNVPYLEVASTGRR